MKSMRCGPGVETLVDEDFFLPPRARLRLDGHGRCEIRWYLGSIKGKCRYEQKILSRYIVGLEKGDPREVDHINRNPLDNRRINLRACTRQENARNRQAKCVWRTPNGKWASCVSVNGRSLHLGTFDTEVMAIAESNEHKKKNHGEFAAPWPLVM
jgi:hypothetical protein